MAEKIKSWRYDENERLLGSFAEAVNKKRKKQRDKIGEIIMKRILMAAVMLSGISMSAATYQAKIMINGAGDGVKMAKGTCSGVGSIQNATWLKENNEKIIIASFPAEQEWKKGEFSFIPEKDGKIYLQLLSWAADDKGKVMNGWVLIDDITVEGAALENGNFEGEDISVWKLKIKPDIRAEIVEGSGRDSSKAAKICYECTADYAKPILVKAGQEVKISYWYKIAP